MYSIIIMELLSITSLLYSLLLIFMAFATVQVMAIFFAWTVGVSLLFSLVLNSNKTKIFYAVVCLFPVPLYFFYSTGALIFLIITVPLLLLYIIRFMNQGSFEDYADNFKKALLVVLAAIFVRLATPEYSAAYALAAPFLLIHILSSVFLIRSVRHLEGGMGPGRLQRTNLRYSLLIGGAFLLTTVEQVRRFAIKGGVFILNALYLPFQLLFKLGAWFVALLKYFALKNSQEHWYLPELTEAEDSIPPPLEEVEELVFSGSFLEKIIILLLIGLAFYILYRLIRRRGRRHFHGLDYIEEREYIRGQRKAKNKQKQWGRPPAEPSDQVRYFYKKFLEKLIKRDLKLNLADTSQEIQDKAETLFPYGPAGIRETYISCRYGEKEPTEAELLEMKRLYKELKEG